MDSDTAAGIVIFMFGLLVVGFLVVGFIDSTIYAPHSAEDALDQCIDRGFTTYDTYKRVMFSTKALGVKCEHPTKNYDIEGNGILAVVDN